MKFLMFALAGALVLPTSVFAKDKCADPEDQTTLNQCADAAAKAADKKLNAFYQQVQARLEDDAETRKSLVRAQREWIRFRDAECAFRTAGTGGGSAMPMIAAQCVEAMTNLRSQDMEKYLNCPEGDLGCPLPPATAATNQNASLATAPGSPLH